GLVVVRDRARLRLAGGDRAAAAGGERGGVAGRAGLRDAVAPGRDLLVRSRRLGARERVPAGRGHAVDRHRELGGIRAAALVVHDVLDDDQMGLFVLVLVGVRVAVGVVGERLDAGP